MDYSSMYFIPWFGLTWIINYGETIFAFPLMSSSCSAWTLWFAVYWWTDGFNLSCSNLFPGYGKHSLDTHTVQLDDVYTAVYGNSR